MVIKRLNWSQKITFCYGRGPESCYISNHTFCFQLMIITRVFRTREGIYSSKGGFQHHKVAPRPQKRPITVIKRLNWSKKITFCYGRGPESCYISNHTFCFQLMIISRLFTTREGIYSSQTGSLTTKSSLNMPTKYKITSKTTCCADRAPGSYYASNQTLHFC